MKKLLVASFYFCLLPVAAWSAEKYDDLKTYYPSSIDSSWVYEGSMAGDTGAKTKIIESNDELFMSLTAAKLGFKDVFERRGNKLLHIARQNSFEGKAMNNLERLDNPIIELVSPLKKNTKWKYETSGGEECRCSLDLVNSFTVKAGTFKNVIKRSCMMYSKENGKWKLAKGFGIITYFAPNVGMVRMDHEKKDSKPWYELIEYDIK
ncbi:MAG TPA: hypothetical protein VGJ93_07230 [Desulfuromonadaceae bacterium]|jgi:hypothetical protein